MSDLSIATKTGYEGLFVRVWSDTQKQWFAHWLTPNKANLARHVATHQE